MRFLFEKELVGVQFLVQNGLEEPLSDAAT